MKSRSNRMNRSNRLSRSSCSSYSSNLSRSNKTNKSSRTSRVSSVNQRGGNDIQSQTGGKAVTLKTAVELLRKYYQNKYAGAGSK